MLANLRVATALETVRSTLNKAHDAFEQWQHLSFTDEEIDINRNNTIYHMSAAFIQLLTLLDSLGLQRTYDEVKSLREEALKSGLDHSAMGVEEPYLVWRIELFKYLNALGATYSVHSDNAVTRDILTILAATVHTLTDRKIFKAPPANEAELHVRIEGILKSVFPDLKSKPRITKPIKNFEPDTGLPSLRTLVEYKYITNDIEAKRIADEILADHGGYRSPEWDSLIYVIYETKRIRPELEWNNFLRANGVPESSIVIVLQGEPP